MDVLHHLFQNLVALIERSVGHISDLAFKSSLIVDISVGEEHTFVLVVVTHASAKLLTNELDV